MNNLSAPMRYALENSFVTEHGLYGFTSDVRTQTITGLITRGLAFRDDFDNTPYLNKAGEAVRSELLYPDQGDVNPPVEQYADWERELLGIGDNHIAEYLAAEATETPSQNATDGPDTSPEGDTAIDPVNAAQGVSDASEDTWEAVPGLVKLLDTPHVVPNRKDKRNRKRIIRAFNRLFARKRDEQTKKRTDAAKAARKRGRKVSA